jgi:hypothetical protein
MASTRNINTRGDYGLEKNYYDLGKKYYGYKYSQCGKAYYDSIPSLGMMPDHMPRDSFSHNSVDIESALLGINSTNLVNPQKPIKPDFKKLPTSNFFNRIPIIMPKPLVVEDKQRPYPI